VGAHVLFGPIKKYFDRNCWKLPLNGNGSISSRNIIFDIHAVLAQGAFGMFYGCFEDFS
jgi:hypothetical protein